MIVVKNQNGSVFCLPVKNKGGFSMKFAIKGRLLDRSNVIVMDKTHLVNSEKHY